MSVHSLTSDRDRVGYGRILRLALPMIVQGLILSAMLLVDRLFISHYDMIGLAAVGTAGEVAMAMGFLFNGMIAFSNDMVAQYYGAERKEMYAAPVWAGLFLALISAALLLGTLPGTQYVFRLFNHPEELRLMEKEYFRFMIGVQAVSLFQFALVSFFIGRGETLKSMIIAVIGNIVNIIFDWLLIFGVGPFPEMGVGGAGLASLLGALTSVTLAVLFFIHSSGRFEGILKPRFQPDVIRRLFKFGFPAGLKMGLEAGGYAFLALSLGKIGEAAAAASAISFGLQNFAYMPIVSISIAGAILVGQERGAGREHNFKYIIRRVLIIANIYAISVIALMWLFPDFLINLYGSGEEHLDVELLADTQRIAKGFLFVAGFWLVPDTFFNIYMQVLKALGDSRYLSIILTWSVFVLMIIPTWILSTFFVHTVWVKYAIYSTIVLYVAGLAIAFILRYRSNKWKDIRVIS